MKKNTLISVISLVLGSIMLYFSGSANNIAVFGWFWPAFFIWFNRNHKKPWLIFTLILYCLVRSLGSGDAFGTGNMLISLMFTSLYCIFTYIPFIADTVFAPKLGALSVLIFPFAVAVDEFLISLTHFSLIENYAYTQFDNLAFMQVSSIIGTFGLSVLVAMASSLIVYWYENDFKFSAVKRPAVIYLAILFACNIYGSLRLFVGANTEETIKVALASGPELETDENGEWGTVSYDENVAVLREAFEQADTSRAELIAFCEEAFCISDSDEEKFLEEISSLAKKHNLFVEIPLEIEDEDGDMNGLSANKSYLIDNNGEILNEYYKSMLVPVIETSYYVKGDGEIPSVDVNINGKDIKVSMVICYDGDFPAFIQTMDKDTDIYFNPSWEWDNIHKFHSNSSNLRAIENGANLIKPTYLGYSITTDYLGNRISCDTSLIGDISVADVPIHGVRTFYGQFGAIINSAYVIVLAVLLALSVAKIVKKEKR